MASSESPLNSWELNALLYLAAIPFAIGWFFLHPFDVCSTYRHLGRICVLGVLTGFALTGSTFSFFQATRVAKVATSYAFINLAPFISLGFCFLFLDETLTVRRVVSILGAAGALYSLAPHGNDSNSAGLRTMAAGSDTSPSNAQPRVYLVASLFFSGAVLTLNKMVYFFHLDHGRSLYILVMFATAFLLNTLMTFARKDHSVHLALGTKIIVLIMGFLFFSGMVTLIEALNIYPASDALPARAAGSVALTTILTSQVWGERLQVKDIFGIALTVVNVFLLLA